MPMMHTDSAQHECISSARMKTSDMRSSIHALPTDPKVSLHRDEIQNLMGSMGLRCAPSDSEICTNSTRATRAVKARLQLLAALQHWIDNNVCLSGTRVTFLCEYRSCDKAGRQCFTVPCAAAWQHTDHDQQTKKHRPRRTPTTMHRASYVMPQLMAACWWCTPASIS
jgi:hypothetical protein